MSEVIEKRAFKALPCRIDNSLLREIGQILEEEASKLYEELAEISRQELSERDYYKKYPKELKAAIEEAVYTWRYKPQYILIADSKNIESSQIAHFSDIDLPPDTSEISLSMGSSDSPKKIEIHLYLESWRARNSEVSVAGKDSTWVNGIAERLEAIFQKKKLGYHLVVEHSSLRILLSILTWISLAFLITHLLWPVTRTILEEKEMPWYFLFVATFFTGIFPATMALEGFLSWLFPRFEFGEISLPRRVRKWIWALLMGSGFIASIIFKLLGL